MEWLSRQQPLTVTMEACGSAHYWARLVKRMGHHPLLCPRVRQFDTETNIKPTQPTRAIGVAARQPKVKFVAQKTVDQQAMQGIERIREYLSDQLTSTSSDLIRGLLKEFGLLIPQGISAFKSRVVDILEDADNDLPMPLRLQLIESWGYYQELETRLKAVE